MKIRALVLFVAAVLLVDAHGEDKGKDDMDKLKGTWTCVSGVNDGKALAEATVQKLRLTLTKNGGYKTERGKQVLFDSTYKIDSSKQPKHIDLIGTEGENKGKAAQGIYVLEGETLTICYTMPGKDRPKEFASKPGSGAALVVWKRKADVEKELKKFQGTWRFESVEADGKKVPAAQLKGMTVTFEGDKFTVKKGDEVIQVARQKIDPSTSPKTLDVRVAEGLNKGAVMLGIYEISGDTLKVCFDPEGKKRPTELKGASGPQILVVHKRVKK